MKSDTQLRRDVEEELAIEPTVDAAAIGVAAEDGIVTLSGARRELFRKTGSGAVCRPSCWVSAPS